MTPKEIRKRIAELEALIAPLKDELHTLLQALAHKTCPYQVGDIWERQQRWGWANPPTYRTQRVKISSVNPGYGPDDFKIFGHRIKNDGTEGTRVRIWMSDKYTKES